MDWATWSPTVAAILASGSVAALVSHLLVGRRERSGLLRQKAEELYVSVEEFEVTWGMQAVMLAGAVRNEITYSQYLDLWNENAKSIDGKTSRKIEMLTRIYFPSIAPKLDALFVVRDEFAKRQMAHQHAYKDGVFDAFSWNDDFQPLVLRFRSLCDDYKRSITKCAQKSFSPLRLNVG